METRPSDLPLTRLSFLRLLLFLLHLLVLLQRAFYVVSASALVSDDDQGTSAEPSVPFRTLLESEDPTVRVERGLVAGDTSSEPSYSLGIPLSARPARKRPRKKEERLGLKSPTRQDNGISSSGSMVDKSISGWYA